MAKSKKNVKKQEALYYFYSVGCGFCKKAEPIVDELNESGKYEILKLDLSVKDNQELNKQLKMLDRLELKFIRLAKQQDKSAINQISKLKRSLKVIKQLYL